MDREHPGSYHPTEASVFFADLNFDQDFQLYKSSTEDRASERAIYTPSAAQTKSYFKETSQGPHPGGLGWAAPSHPGRSEPQAASEAADPGRVT